MNCPHCDFKFRVLAMNAQTIPDVAPIICESCGEVSIIVEGKIRKATEGELESLKESPAWRDVILPAKRLIENQKRARKARFN